MKNQTTKNNSPLGKTGKHWSPDDIRFRIGSDFVNAFERMQEDVHATALSKGWYDQPDWVSEAKAHLPPHLKEEIDNATNRNLGEAIALIQSEASEALEALRHGNPPDDKVPEFSGVEAEFADIIIRIMDISAFKGWNVAGAILAKAEMNKSRPPRHGKKF